MSMPPYYQGGLDIALYSELSAYENKVKYGKVDSSFFIVNVFTENFKTVL